LKIAEFVEESLLLRVVQLRRVSESVVEVLPGQPRIRVEGGRRQLCRFVYDLRANLGERAFRREGEELRRRAASGWGSPGKSRSAL